MQKLVDDILVTGRSKGELLERIEQVLESCKEHKITLSDSNMHMGTEVKFAGHVIKGQGSKQDPNKVKAIEDFPVPETIENNTHVNPGYNTKYYKKPKPLNHISPKPLNHTIFQNYLPLQLTETSKYYNTLTDILLILFIGIFPWHYTTMYFF